MSEPSRVDDHAAFPTLDGNQLATLDALGTRRSVAPGEYLYREGDATYDFFVVVSGAVDIVLRVDDEERVVAVVPSDAGRSACLLGEGEDRSLQLQVDPVKLHGNAIPHQP